ncbi:EF-TU receptor [Hibiscus trionum]|uniref:non-specific serine/threonine protein kinase n=1 Tax=Hibiscus trionum TaxID=183268 RepID=A0A9W7M753_HIBTR|nr:EF-TU receptor [Hibiscus trionum]
MAHLQFLLLLFSLFQLHLNSCTSQQQQLPDLDSTTDNQALLSFKLQLSHPQNALSGWTQNSSHCNWFGITCTTNGSRVESLQLSSLGLVGTLAPSLSNLTSLTTLNLSHNSFHGQFRLEFSKLSLLQHIDLRNNSINGTVPASLSHCYNLETVRFQGNKFSGNIPPQLGNLQRLTTLSFSINNLTGSIPSTFGNLSSLASLGLARNMLVGEIPSELGRLTNLQQIQLSDNHLSGQIPASILNMSSLVYLSVTQNSLSGNLPNLSTDGFQALPNLKELYLALNRFEGIVPGYILNASSIEWLDLSRNRFHGPIPLFGYMRKLVKLDLGQNLFSSNTARNFQLIDSLANCTQLEYLMINSNRLSGEFPSVANLSSNMQHFCISDNLLTGGFPQGIDKFQNLISLSIEMNSFTGDIPRSIARLRNLQSLLVYENMFSGEIPETFANLTRVSDIAMGNNQFSGKIPISLGDCPQLQTLDLSWNRLNGSIPEEIFKLSNLNYLILVHNMLSGPISSEVGNLKQLQVIDVSENNLFGKLTPSISGCSILLYLNISMNNISGDIPNSLGSIVPLEVLDLSYNNLSGPIPRDLENLKSLKMLNLSFNHLEGEVPTGNIFSNRSLFSIRGNGELCSSDQEIARNLELPQCKTEGRRERNDLLRILVPTAGATLFICLVFCFVWALISRRKKQRAKGSKSSLSVKGLPPLISYSDIHLATGNFAAKNLLGKGGFGSVYEARFNNGDNGTSINNLTLAVKVLDLQQTKAVQGFLAECEVLRNVRHRNLVKIITSCSSVDHKGDQFKALVYEFMPNGNLEKWLYPEDIESGAYLTLLQRLNIAIDVASAMDYLHNDCEPPVVHCDLKPANVLLDENMAAHVGDFGLARFLSPSPSQSEKSTSGLKGSVGYIAPEYGLGSKASTNGDVYSFGVLLLEMFIAKKPTDGMFKGLASAMDRNQVFETADPRLLMNHGSSVQSWFSTSSSDGGSSSSATDSDHIGRKYEECLAGVIRVGLCCAAQSSKDRLSMRETLTKLHDVKKYLLS